MKYSTKKEVLATLGVCKNTLYSMVKRGEIEAIKIKGKYLFNLEKLISESQISTELKTDRKKIIYCRVSSTHQTTDLTHQIEVLKELYPEHSLITDVGSGLNFKRKGFLSIIKMIFNEELEELVVTYKDRLCRFGFDLIKTMIEEFSDGRIIVVNHLEEKTPMGELTEDILSIMNIFVAKINGLRKYKTKIKRDIDSGVISHKN